MRHKNQKLMIILLHHEQILPSQNYDMDQQNKQLFEMEQLIIGHIFMI